ncbi:MAG: DUF3465 domain-containing protein, partial [Gammaproteobacteria bacterium]|nr:DUF3465 domain-containing protein [Gammaproteobacteria bacterium]
RSQTRNWPRSISSRTTFMATGTTRSCRREGQLSHVICARRLSSGQTILIAHNIDLAPRVSSLNEGDVVSFSGEYEWNPKGGVVHWTHRDSDGRHSAGWIKHDRQAFQ